MNGENYNSLIIHSSYVFLSSFSSKTLYIQRIYTAHMATEVINIKLDSKFLKEIDKVVAKNNYHNRTELIREALRGKVDESKVKELRAYYDALRSKHGRTKQTTDEEIHKIREEVFNELHGTK
jgi:Arc/MetJ-type ribon-helix-helix transcriptional regulator